MALGEPLPGDLLTATFSEVGRSSGCLRHGGRSIHVPIVQDRVDPAPPSSSRQLWWFDEQVLHAHAAGRSEGFLLVQLR